MADVFVQIAKKLIPLWLGATVVALVMNYMENKVLVPEKILAEGFYYGAIVFAIWHIINKRKQREAEAVKAMAAKAEENPEEGGTEGDGGADETGKADAREEGVEG